MLFSPLAMQNFKEKTEILNKFAPDLKLIFYVKACVNSSWRKCLE